MDALFIGLVLGVGLLLVLTPFVGAPQVRITPPQRYLAWQDQVVRSRIRGATPVRIIAVSVAVSFLAFVLVYLWTGVGAVSAVIALLLLPVPSMIVASRARSTTRLAREGWPDAIDFLVSGVRAGAGLPELLGELGTSGPEALRPPFAAFAADYRAEGRFDIALTRLKQRLADPIADRVIEALRLARDVGGADLSLLLRDLGILLREDARVRGELEARQSWTVNAARLAVVAPWIVLVMISSRSNGARVWNTPTGIGLLVGGGVACVAAYLLMRYVGRLSMDARTLR